MKYWRFIFYPLSILYAILTEFRNWLFKVRIKRSFKFSIPVINVGNLSMGGTGKTPHIEYLIRLLKDNHHLATLSRGFGRKERGFIIANEQSNAEQIGDEPLQFYKKYGKDITVCVEADRVKGVMDLCYAKEEIDLVLLDDAFQHQAIKPGFNILLTDYNKPFYKDFILPVGDLREMRRNKNRADIIVVTKCPNFDTVDKTQIINFIKPNNNQEVFFSKIIYNPIITPVVVGKIGLNPLVKYVIVVTGIANPNPLIDYISKKYKILKHVKFSDHYQFKETDIDDIHNLLVKFDEFSPIIITTEKDAMRLVENDLEKMIIDKPWFYQGIEIEINRKKEFNNKILDYVQKNRRDY
jgi:tetraacyldisaccharide 4'-kinase